MSSNTYSQFGLATFVLRHNTTGLYFARNYGFVAGLDSAARFPEADMTIITSVVRYTWGENFTAIQVGN